MPRVLGHITRGKTAPNRLRKTDTFLAVAYPELVRRLPGVYVDLGYGAYPITSVETLQRLRPLNPSLQVVGVEIDPERVTAAQPFVQPGLEFRVGGFNLPLRAGERVSVIRAFNVLRQYAEAEVTAALATLGQALATEGLLIEGTCDPLGRLLTFNLYQKVGGTIQRHEPVEWSPDSAATAGGLRLIAFVLAPSLRTDFLPRQFQAVLPKNFIHHAEPGGAIDRFFAAWHAAWQHARAHAQDRRQIFYHAALRLNAHYGYALDRRPALLKRGFLCLGPTWPALTFES